MTGLLRLAGAVSAGFKVHQLLGDILRMLSGQNRIHRDDAVAIRTVATGANARSDFLQQLAGAAGAALQSAAVVFGCQRRSHCECCEHYHMS
jgi:hypothetical protein